MYFYSRSYILKNMKTCIGGDLKGTGRIDRLIVCYAVYDPLYKEWGELAPVCIFHKGLPSEEELENQSLIKKDCNNLMVIDDLDDRENECETIHRWCENHY